MLNKPRLRLVFQELSSSVVRYCARTAILNIHFCIRHHLSYSSNQGCSLHAYPTLLSSKTYWLKILCQLDRVMTDSLYESYVCRIICIEIRSTYLVDALV